MKKLKNKSTKAYNNFKHEDLKSNDKNSIQYFSNLRWKEKKKCPKCGNDILYDLKPNRYGCKKCRYKFYEFTGTYLGKWRKDPSLITQLLLLFASGTSAHMTTSQLKQLKQLKCHKSTIERVFQLFREAIYDKSLEQIQQLQQKKSLKEIEIDGTILDVPRKNGKESVYGWSYTDTTNLIFGIYQQKNTGIIVTFPLSNINDNILYRLEKEIDNNKWPPSYNNHGSFYKVSDQIAYAMIRMVKKGKIVTHTGITPRGEPVNFDIDDFWYYVNKWLYHYRAIQKTHFPLYLKEIEFRFNNRNNDIFYELSKLLVESLPTL